MTLPTERIFAYFERGRIREDYLRHLRNGLRQLVNPETGDLFTEDEIAAATQQGSMLWREADALDICVGMPQQSRALWLADQVRTDRASSGWLVGYHGALWGVLPLDASPGWGPVSAPAVAGTIFVGSTTPGDPSAHIARDPAGMRYQVQSTVTTPAGGVAPLTLVAIDTGDATNPKAGTVLTWGEPPIGAQPTCTVSSDFSGGMPAESEADYSKRMADGVRHKQGAGNVSQFRAWAREASNAVLDAYVYACAFHAGSVLVCITQKRGSTPGPNALIPANGSAVLGAVTAYVVPPGSPVVPARPFVAVVPPVAQSTNVVLQLSQPRGSNAGWTDLVPFPAYIDESAGSPEVTAVTDTKHFRMTSQSDGGIGSGANAPHMMVWDVPTSRFVELAVSSVTQFDSTHFDVVLLSDPSHAIAVGDRISPKMARHETVATAVETYFDSLGPGEVVNLANDVRADRAFRFPEAIEEAPARIGQGIIGVLEDALGASLADAYLRPVTSSTPTLPVDPIVGPHKLTIGKLGIYDMP